MSCLTPFSTLYLLPRGFVTCCQSWVDERHWHMRADTPPARVWTVPEFVTLRQKVLRGDFSACQRCARRLGGEVPELVSMATLPVYPEHLILCNDLACNLHCWSCRTAPFGLTEGHELREARMRAVLDEYLPTAKLVTLLQSGEVFASPMHLRWLQSLDQARLPDLRVIVTTNGTLLPRRWSEIEPAHYAIREISISVDAATPGTYQLVRRGGRWSDVTAGVRFAGELRRTKRLDQLQLNFCAQRDNWREIPDFVRFGRDVGADKIKFTLLRRWWQNEQQFAAASLETPDHPDRAAFLQMVASDPTLRLPEVDATLLRAM